MELNKNTEQSNEINNTIEYKKIDDILSFKISQNLYSLPKPFTDVPRKGVHSSKL